MNVRALVASAAVAILGCDSTPKEADTAATTPDTTAADVATSDTALPDTAAADSSTLGDDDATPEATAGEADTSPADTAAPDTTLTPGPHLTFTIDPFTVESGKERQVCRTVNIPSDQPFDIVRFTSQMKGISHHFNLYKVIDDSALVPVTPDETAVHDCSPAAEQLRGDAAYIYGSASPDRTMETPPGVAFHLEPGQRLIIEYHAINYTTEPIEASLEIDLDGASPDAQIDHFADIIWFANWGFLLPPGKTTSDTTSCIVPYDVQVFGMMSHYHSLGTDFTVDAIQAGTSTPVYENHDWQHPSYEEFAPTLELDKGDSLQWTCTWDNTTDHVVLPNKGSKDEMCMVFAAAYPKNSKSADPIQCNVLF